MIRPRLGALAGALLLTLGLVAPVSAAEPANDDISSPTMISLPSTTSQSTIEATLGPTDPMDCAAGGRSVWFSYTALADGSLQATTYGSDYDTALVVGTQNGDGGIDVIGCNDDTVGLQSAVRFDAASGSTYLLMVGSFLDGPGGELVLNLDPAPPPPVVGLTIDGGTFSVDGTATINGTVSCGGLADVGIELFLEQTVGRVTISGYGGTVQPCDAGETAWSVAVISADGKFLGGRVRVSAYASGCNELECVADAAEVVVRLRR